MVSSIVLYRRGSVVVPGYSKKIKMYSAEVNAKHANYYLPVQHDDIPPCKKRCENTSQPRHTARILGRRYALTATSYKYLEIGISVGPVPTVEIILGDNCGNQLILPTETWRKLMGRRINIQRLPHTGKPSPLSIQD
ncbi:uncharacterized protein LOC116852762 [Odontomachus brunneus]|uniref:uncharacterized protein LOC116852762 n=1 Tax=Odontomachus brunneus TaxID=486640 RepID=UPI0013F2532A|nr:uncharacterized protein LOC116852762 [Odontomachus brunneus]